MQQALVKTLKAAEDTLLLSVKLSKQGAYHRRAPARDSLPYFEKARQLLEEVLQHDPRNRSALVMMSRLWESLMDFDAAEGFLTRALAAGEPKTKNSLKRLALLRENAAEWRDLRLTPEELRALGQHLESMEVGPSHRTIQLTRDWLVENGLNAEEVVAALGRRGAFSDFQVLANVVHG